MTGERFYGIIRPGLTIQIKKGRTMTQRLTRPEVLSVIETVFWMITVCAIIVQLSCGLYIMGGKDIAVMKWWYAGSVIAFCVFGIWAVTIAYKTRKVNVKTQHALSNARMALLFSWLCFPVFAFGFGGSALNLYLLGRTDAFALVLAPFMILPFSLCFPMFLYWATQLKKSVWE